MAQKRILTYICYDLKFWPLNLVKGHCTFLTCKQSFGNSGQKLGQDKRKYGHNRIWCAMTFILNLENWFNSGYCIYQQTLFIWSLRKIGKIKYGSEKDGLEFDLKKLFKVIVHPLPKAPCKWNMRHIGPKDDKICSRQVILDGQTDR